SQNNTVYKRSAPSGARALFLYHKEEKDKMTKEFLKSLGIEGDAADSIITQAGNEIAEAEKAQSAKYGDYDDIKSQLSEANKQIEEFGKLDFEGVKKSAEEYKAKYDEAVKESAAKLEKLQFDHILDSRLAEMKPRNAKAVKALLDMEGLKLNGNEIVGLKDQLDKIKSENDYLFGAEDIPRYTGPVHGSSSGGSSDDAIRAIMGLSPLNANK
ncbi:MAG: phage scaffolding protein, partial [Huintestinicola sp.]